MIQTNEPNLVIAHKLIQQEIRKKNDLIQHEIYDHKQTIWQEKAQLQQRLKSVEPYKIIFRCIVSNDRTLSFELREGEEPVSTASKHGGISRSSFLVGKTMDLRLLSSVAARWEYPFVKTLVLMFRNDILPSYDRLIKIRHLLEIQLKNFGIDFDPLLHITTPKPDQINTTGLDAYPDKRMDLVEQWVNEHFTEVASTNQ